MNGICILWVLVVEREVVGDVVWRAPASRRDRGRCTPTVTSFTRDTQ